MSAEEGTPAAPSYDEYEAYEQEIEANEEEATEETTEANNGESSTKEVDQRSVYVGNVDYSTTAEQLKEHFSSCGEMNLITIPVDRNTGSKKGFAYIEFAEVAAVAEAVKLSDSTLNGRVLKVTAKRTNVPGFNRGGRGGARGGSFRGGRGAAMMGGMNPKMMMQMMNAMQMAMRGGRGGFRGGFRGGRGGARGGRGGHGGNAGGDSGAQQSNHSNNSTPY